MREEGLYTRLGGARIRSVGVAVFLASLVLGACGDDDDSADTTSGAGAATTAAAAATTADATTDAGSSNTLTIANLAFSDLTVKAGDEITIVNDDSFTHTVTADDGSFDVEVGGGETATLTIPAAGSFAIHCRFHSSMHGTIVVT
jgi:plastocyanin